MKDITVIDLTLLDDQKIVEVCDMFESWKLVPELLKQDKNQGVQKLFIDTHALQVIGYTLKSDPNNIIFLEDFIKSLEVVVPLQMPKQLTEPPKQQSGPKKKSVKVVFSVDAILDKIGSSGIESLTLEEKQFLDDFSSK